MTRPPLPRPSRFASAALASLAAAAVVASPAPAAPLPGWTIAGAYDQQIDVGFRSIDGDYTLSLEGLDGTVTLSYPPKGGLQGGGFIGFDFVKLRGSYSVDEAGVQQVEVEEDSRNPRFLFTGAVDDAFGHFVGTYERKDGFASLAGPGTGALTFSRTPATAPVRTWRLLLPATMDRKGRVRGALAQDGESEERALLLLFGGFQADGGKIRGRVRTTKGDDVTPPATTAKLRIVGRDWLVKMNGPVDVDGFHASVDFHAAGFHVLDVPVVFAVGPGPEPPPPPPPKVHKIEGVTATIASDRVTLRKARIPDRVFGKRADVTVEFPLADANTTVGADPSTASGASARLLTSRIGTIDFGTATAPALVSLTIRRTSVEKFEVLCSGTIADASGTKTKAVSFELFASTE